MVVVASQSEHNKTDCHTYCHKEVDSEVRPFVAVEVHRSCISRDQTGPLQCEERVDPEHDDPRQQQQYVSEQFVVVEVQQQPHSASDPGKGQSSDKHVLQKPVRGTAPYVLHCPGQLRDCGQEQGSVQTREHPRHPLQRQLLCRRPSAVGVGQPGQQDSELCQMLTPAGLHVVLASVRAGLVRRAYCSAPRDIPSGKFVVPPLAAGLSGVLLRAVCTLHRSCVDGQGERVHTLVAMFSAHLYGDDVAVSARAASAKGVSVADDADVQVTAAAVAYEALQREIQPAERLVVSAVRKNSAGGHLDIGLEQRYKILVGQRPGCREGGQQVQQRDNSLNTVTPHHFQQL
mmetsp:Transcript_20936/g.41501  ORF Transcript_20936/g.41501 Transcript_20936/m.41501 type:complete len:345 (+) Transcript_20936:714-1748(+)